jgi:hypothetical protein
MGKIDLLKKLQAPKLDNIKPNELKTSEANKPPKNSLAQVLTNGTMEKLKKAQEEKRKNPIQQKYENELARQSILGESSSNQITGCQPCLASAKTARRRQRLDLVSRAIVACPKRANEAARLRQDMDEVENMRCARHVYIANDENATPELRDNPPPGFLKPTPEQLTKMGINQKMLSPENSNFRAAVYMKDPAVWGPEPKPAAVLAFRGSTPVEEDWYNNFAQNLNKDAPYYRRAVFIGDRLRESNADIQLVGHSLGGGLASAAQGASGLNASTYNASGLHPQTVPRYLTELNKPVRNAEADKINAIRVKGEILTKTQENFWGSKGVSTLSQTAVGTKRNLDSATSESDFKKLMAEKKVGAKDKYDTYLHGIDETIAATEKQKTADEAALQNCLDKR